MTRPVIALIAGAVFILIATIGGGFTIKELTVPQVSKAGRIGAGVVGILFVCYSILITLTSSVPSGQQAHAPAPGTGEGEGATIHTDDRTATSPDHVKLSRLKVASQHDPPRVNDQITISFSLQNDGRQSITLGSTFIATRDPSKEHKDFTEGDYTRVLKPGEFLNVKRSIIVTQKGSWKFWPCYTIDNKPCPNEWQAFNVVVVDR